MLYVVDACVLGIVACILRNFSLGFFLVLCSRMFFPVYVRFSLGPISVAVFDFFLPFLLISFLLERTKSLSLQENSFFVLPRKILVYLGIVYVSSFVLMCFSMDEIPFGYQLSCFLKTLCQDVLYTVMGYYAFKCFDSKYMKCFWWTAFVVGLYGIFVYLLKFNLYIDVLSNLYVGENRFEFFAEQIRGGLVGRSSGTLDHPLSWGQMWGCLLALYFICGNTIKYKVLQKVFPILAVINIFVSGSRAAIIVALVIVLMSLIVQGAWKMIRFIALMLVCLILVVVLFNDNSVVMGMESYLKSVVFFWDDSYAVQADIGGSSANMRSEQLKTSFEIVETNLLCGMGYSAVGYYGSTYFVGMRGFESIVYKKIVEQGVLGLVFFIWSYVYLSKWIVGEVCCRREKILWIAYFVSYFVSIVFTGIQNTWSIFFFISFLALKHKINKT